MSKWKIQHVVEGLQQARHEWRERQHRITDDHRLTYKQFIALTSEIYGKPLSYSVIPKWALTIAKFFSPQAKEVQELLPRYAKDNLFISDKFKQRFPQFKVTTYRQGIEQILKEQ